MIEGSQIDQKQIWRMWATQLQQWRLRDFALWLLDSASPVHLIGAQLVYIGQPLLEAFVPNGQFKALTSILEQPAQAQAFAEFLREEP